MSRLSPITNLPAVALAKEGHPSAVALAKEGHQSAVALAKEGHQSAVALAKEGHQSINKPILLFDGVCNLCNASVQWVLKHDRRGEFRFSALQSELGQQLLLQHGLASEHFDTVVLVVGEQIFLRSDAPLEIVRRLGGLWRLLYFFKILPRPLRDAVYNFVARNRYRWFGRREECMLPKPEWKERFL